MFTKHCKYCNEVKLSFSGDKCRDCRFTPAVGGADRKVNNLPQQPRGRSF
jgi:hypothetical protein